jgi:hypothetical protein
MWHKDRFLTLVGSRKSAICPTGSLIDLAAARAVPVRPDRAVASHGSRIRGALRRSSVSEISSYRITPCLLAGDDIAKDGDGCRVAEPLQFRNIMA